MKKVCKYIILGLLPLLTASCILDLDIVEPVQPGGNIVLDLSSGIQTKAIEYGSVGAEAYVNHVDLFIFGAQKNADGATVNSHHERIAFNVTGNGTKTLGVKKVWFTQGQSYDVYVIANSTASVQTMSSITDVQGLWRLTQEDKNLHVTGLHYGEGTQEDAVPDFFLMDGRGYTDEAGTEAVLNDGDMSANVVITAELARAAAKVVVELNKGGDVRYLDPSTQGVYYYRNLPYDTVVMEADRIGYEISPKTVTHELEVTNDYVAWDKTAGKITVTGYVYAYSWSELDKETSLVVNIPVVYDANRDGTFDAETETKANNFYKIPLSKERKFERNHIYKVTATVNAPGSESDFTPVEIEDLKYHTYSWTKIWPNITVGGETNKPQYLQLNQYHVDMYNVNEDNKTLQFSSSSYITGIELIEAYYYNKYSQYTSVPTGIQAAISAIPEVNVLNGKISIFSPVVATTAEEREQLRGDLIASYGGSAPTQPSGSRPEDPEPDPYDYLPENSDSEQYRYENGSFQKRSWFIVWSDWQNTTAPAEYTAALNDWKALSDDAKAAAKAEYEAELQEYNSQAAAYEEYQAKLAGINATESPSHYNTVRYLKFRVRNSQGLTAEFTVAQYPVIYITNVVGWYSYRDDFKTNSDTPTTYLTKGDGIVGISYNKNDKSYSYNTSSSGFWYSKVNTNVSSSGTVDNTLSDYTIRAYNWSGNSVSITNPVSFGTNTRMYHIEVTSTSKDYIVGRPRMVDPNGNTTTDVENSITADDAANARLVSPSFMTASRLGALNSGALDLSDLSQADALAVCKEHCKNYVEVVADGKGTVYSDWRLPTAAEIGIIVSLQGSGSSDNTTAIDYLLNANYYYSASGPVANDKVGSSLSGTTSVRCIRDVY